VQSPGQALRASTSCPYRGRRGRQRADKLGIAARTVTDLVDGLERQGLLERRPDPSDRRATLLELTPSAHTHFDGVRAIQRELSEEMLAPLDPNERRQLLDFLKRLREGTAAHGGSGSGYDCV
jgi:DNA-binding MarR family transcriptional regulator